MNCREYIIEFEERGTLSKPATLHLTVCTDCKKMSDRQTQIWLMIDELKPVAAPSDFDFHVKARIAKVNHSNFQSPRFLPILRYVLPLSVVVLLFGLFAYNSAYFSENPQTSQIAQIETANVNNFFSTNTSSINPTAFAPSDEDKMIVKPAATDEKSLTTAAIITDVSKTESKRRAKVVVSGTNQSNKSSKTKADNNPGGGSRVDAWTKGKILLPKGFNSASDRDSMPKFESPKQVGDEQLLVFLGIETVLESGKRTVKALAKDKTGERSGVKAGDVIEKIRGSSLTVMRGTEKIEIILQNNVGQPR